MYIYTAPRRIANLLCVAGLCCVLLSGLRAVADEDDKKLLHSTSQELMRIWERYARAGGEIPGGLIDRLRVEVKYFATLNEGSELARRSTELLPRFEANRDWSVEEAVGLLNAVTSIHEIPVENCLQRFREMTISVGEPLPEELVDVAWGKPADNGLRVAWFLEPDSKWHRLGTPLRSRILVHNSGDQPVFFLMPSWQQSGAHKAIDNNGNLVTSESTYWTTRALRKIVRLAPGEYIETPAAGIGIGERSDRQDWGNFRPGTWVKASAGDRVRLIPGAVELRYSASVNGTRMIDGKAENVDPKTGEDLWKWFVSQRVQRVLPFPKGKEDQKRVLNTLTSELFGKQVETRDLDEFLADDSENEGALRLTQWLLKDKRLSAFTGTLQPGEIRFRVLPADPEAEKKPRVATGPGYYSIRDRVRLQIQRSPDGDRRVNRATLRFFSGSSKVDPPAPVQVSLPDGIMTYAIVWERDAKELWAVQKNGARRYDFSDEANVRETAFKTGDTSGLPKQLADAVTETFKMLGAELQ